MDERIKKMWCIYTTEYYLAIKKNEILPFGATWMDLEGITLSEISQRRTNMRYHLYVESKKIKQTSKCNKKRSKLTENKVVVTSGQREGETRKIGVED